MIKMRGMERKHLIALRKKRRWTQDLLAEKAQISQGHYARIEAGKRGLSMSNAEKIADALGVDVTEVLGLRNAVERHQQPASGLAEDAEPYEANVNERVAFAPRRGENIDPWRVRTAALDQIGIMPGDIVLVDLSSDAVEQVKPLQAVIAQRYYGEDLGKAETMLRQFIPPAMLVTNSETMREMPLSLTDDDVHIKGVIIAIHRPMA